MYKWVFSERLKSSGDENPLIASGRVFQACGPATAKARPPTVERRVAGTVKSAEEAERRRDRGSTIATGLMTRIAKFAGTKVAGVENDGQSRRGKIFRTGK